MRSKLIFAVVSVLFFQVYSANAQEVMKTADAMFLQLDKAGFAPVSEVIFRNALQDVVRKPMKNYEDTMSGVKVTVSNANYSVDFESLTMEPRAGFLWARVKIKEAKVYADKIRLYKKVLGVPISTTCRDTTITVSGDNLNLQAEFALTVDKKNIVVKPRKVDFTIKEDQYRVSGPRSCSGELGIGSLIKSIVKDALERARGDIEKQVKQQVDKASSEIATQLNKATHLEFEYHLDEVPPLPSAGFRLVTWPQSVRLQNDSARFIFAVSSEVLPESELQPKKDKPRTRSDEKVEEPVAELVAKNLILGSFGINPELLNEVFSQVIGSLPQRVLLDPSAVPGLAKILNIQSLSSVWPDLLELKPDKDFMQIYLTLAGPPQIELSDSKLGFVLRLPQLDLSFQASQDQQWFDYFDLEIGLENGLDMTIADEHLTLKYKSGSLTGLGGDWAESYVPQTDLVEWDVVETLMLTVFDYLYMQDDLLDFKVPKINLAGHDVRIIQPFVQDSKYIAFRLSL